MENDVLIHFGGALKALDEKGAVGGYLVRFGSPTEKDASGEYFTAKTYLGPNDGDGSECIFHHSQPIKGAEQFADHVFGAIKTKRDEVGIFAEAVLDLADEYESKVFDLVKAGKLGWSSGAAPHRVRKSTDGEIKSWPIAEGSLTPQPCEPKNYGGIRTLKSLPKWQLTEITPTKSMELKEMDALVPNPATSTEKKPLKADEAVVEETIEEEVVVEETPITEPFGATLLRDIHAKLMAMLSDCNQAAVIIEPEAQVIETLQACLTTWLEQIEFLEDRFQDHYPELDAPTSKEETVVEETATEEEVVEEEVEEVASVPEVEEETQEEEVGAQKRLTKAEAAAIDECINYMKEVVARDNLTQEQRSAHKYHMGALEKMRTKVAEVDEDAELAEFKKMYDAATPEQKKAIEKELSDTLASLEKLETKNAIAAKHSDRKKRAAQARR